MFILNISKKSLEKLNSTIDAIRKNIDNEQISNYIFRNISEVFQKGAILQAKNGNRILITNDRLGSAFYIEVSPSLEQIEEIHFRFTKGVGDYEERCTITLNQGTLSLHSCSSFIDRDSKNDQIKGIFEKYRDESFEGTSLTHKREFNTSITYPKDSISESNSNLEEITVIDDETAAFESVSISSEKDPIHSFGAFDPRGINLMDSSVDNLRGVRTLNEEEYQNLKNQKPIQQKKELK